MRKNSLYSTPEELFDKINWETVNEKIQEIKILSWEYEEVAALVVTAFNKFAPKDFATWEQVHVERRFFYEVPEIGETPWIQFGVDEKTVAGIQLERCIKGFIDLHAYEKGEDGLQSRVVDWKVSSSLDAVWRNRQTDSWQGKIYARVTGASIVEFRGIQRDGRSTSLSYEWPTKAYNNSDVDNYILQAIAMRESLARSPVWTKRMPYACEAYGRKCPYYTVCRSEEGAKYEQLVPLKPFSYTGMETFFLCAERYRLDSFVEAEEEETSSAAFGKAFHAGIAEAYGQLFGVNNASR